MHDFTVVNRGDADMAKVEGLQDRLGIHITATTNRPDCPAT
jgi:hypothetical protein